ncbi:MAG: alpha-(1-_3)-arabinofuranosyltransferase family protein, partial [Methanolobus sp.]|nr:alpha-(1->3)-arabinofuranosyltransferase family protein [Methanolobus sp.]
MKSLTEKLLVLIAIFSAPLSSLFWIPSAEVLAHGLIYPWPNNSLMMWEFANSYLYSWVSIIGLGSLNTEPSAFLNFTYSFLAIGIAGNSHVGQAFFLYLGFVVCMGGMYVLTQTLGFSKSASIAAGVFYIFSPMVMSGMPIEITNIRLLPFYAATPILFNFCVRSIDSPGKRDLALFGIFSIILGSAGYTGLQFFVLHLILICTYILLKLFSLKPFKVRVATLSQSFYLLVIMFLINLYWLSPLFLDLSGSYAARTEPGYSDIDILRGLSVNIIDGFRMLPYPEQANISPWVAYYYHPVATLVVFSLIMIGIFALLNHDTKKMAMYPGILLIISLFLTKGLKEPFSSLGEFVFLSSPYVTRLFRNPTYLEILVVFAFSLLIGLGIGELVRTSSRKPKKYLIMTVVAVTALFVIFGWQFLIGGPLISSQAELSSAQSVEVPIYFNDFADFLHEDPATYRVLSVPT